MLALKGSSAAEEIDRDREELARLGAGGLEVLECGGAGLLEVPTIVVKAERMARPARRRKKR